MKKKIRKYTPDRFNLILDKYRDTVAVNSAKARNYIRQLDYKNNFYLLGCIAQTYLDESLFEENGSNKMRKELNFRKLRMAEKYIIEAYKLCPENGEGLYTMGSVRRVYDDQKNMAIGCYEDVIKLGVTKISKQEYSRGRAFARELVNDARFELYRLYYDVSQTYFDMYKKGVEKGIAPYTPLKKFLIKKGREEIKQKNTNADKNKMDKFDLMLEKYWNTVATDSAKARNYIRKLDYKDNVYLLGLIAQTYLDECRIEENGNNKINFRKWRMAYNYVMTAYNMDFNNAANIYTIGELRKLKVQDDFLAIFCYKKIIELGVNKIAKQEHSGGRAFARELVNNAKFELYKLYDYTSKKYLAMYKKGLEKGITTIYTPLKKFLIKEQ